MNIKNIDIDVPHNLKNGSISYKFSLDKCELVAIENHKTVPVHVHNFDELVFVLSGTAVHIIDNEQYPILRGDVFVVRRNHKHGYTNTKHLKIVNVLYQREYFESLKTKFANLPGSSALFVHEPLFRKKQKFKSKLHLTSEQLQKVSKIMSLMVSEQDDEWEGTSISKEYIFNLIVINVCKFFSKQTSGRPKTLLKISAAIDFIEQNFEKPISNELLSNITNLTPGSFRYSFKKVTGLSPIDYIIRMRIEKSADLMSKNSRMRVIDAAFQSGFENSAYFTKKFKEIIGMTPIDYLKKQRSLIG